MITVPGKNPGTSTNVMMGILNASQKRTNRAPFTDEFMSRQPALKRSINYAFKFVGRPKPTRSIFSLKGASSFKLLLVFPSS